MVTTPMIHNAIKVNLPRGKAKEDSGTKQELIVFIDEKEQLYFNAKAVTNQELITALKLAVGDDHEKVVYASLMPDIDARQNMAPGFKM